MKWMLGITFCLVTSLASLQAQDETGTSEPSSVNRVIQKEYEIRFKSEDARRSFKLLREFLKEKEAELNNLEKEKAQFADDGFTDDGDTDTSKVDKYQAHIDQLRLVLRKGSTAATGLKVPFYLAYDPDTFFRRGTSFDSTEIMTVENINTLIAEKEKKIGDIRQKAVGYFKTLKNMATSIDNVNKDITLCTRQIDSALAPEYQQQDFRKIISISFSVLIGLLLTIFFCIVYKRSDNSLSKDLLSGNGLQFITLFVLIIAVILFGILNILGSSELAAILSGISGYILGKGTQKDLTTVINASGMNQQHNPAPVNLPGE